MSLTDEVMALVDGYVDGCMGEEDAPEPSGYYKALRSRLSAIETELNDLRNPHFCDECGLPMALIDNPFGAPGKFWNCYNQECYTTPVKYRTPVPPRVESHSTLVNRLDAHDFRITPECLDHFRLKDVEHPSGLPCSNVNDWDGEDGG